MKQGDDILVHYEGQDHRGVVLQHQHGWVLCRIAIDPLWDYGAVTARLTPHTLVMVREDDTQPWHG